MDGEVPAGTRHLAAGLSCRHCRGRFYNRGGRCHLGSLYRILAYRRYLLFKCMPLRDHLGRSLTTAVASVTYALCTHTGF